MNVISSFSTILYSNHFNLLRVISPPEGGGGREHTRSLTACMKFNFEQLSFEAFFEIMHFFWQLSALNESNLQFQFNIIFQPYQSFNGHGSRRGGGRAGIHTRLQTSCTKFNFERLSFEAFFEIM